MNRWLVTVAVLLVLSGCASNPRGVVPVQENGASIYQEQEWMGAEPLGRQSTPRTPAAAPAPAEEEDAGVVVMVPQDAGSAPLQTAPGAIAFPGAGQGQSTGGVSPVISASPRVPAPTGIPQGELAPDEQLDGPVLALLTSARQMQNGGDLNGAASSLERAQRIAPREPQVLYRLADLRLAQGDPAQAEQLARRALTYAGGRPALQASLWELIAKARERQGDPAGAAQARQRAKVSS
ncbi:tetratricopeptide repeat protein [Pseudomonas sp. RL]|uniref:tetratricopeptide repeat protein n=1 Tax=Pseudomonas sp. RL TaxID=1452718 RepID=UPI00068F33FB|nr:tetratricopeptide repeat protein [Pseudomonas sp. RL]